MWLTFGLPMYICIDSTVEAINDGQLWLDLQRFVGLYCLFIQPQITPNSAWVATKSPVRHSVSRSHAHLSLWRWRLDRKATTSSFTWCHSWLLAILRAQEVAFFVSQWSWLRRQSVNKKLSQRNRATLFIILATSLRTKSHKTSLNNYRSANALIVTVVYTTHFHWVF